MKLSISEAARRAGVDRATIHRKIKEGIISKEVGDKGEPLIDLAELARVYPGAVASPQDESNSMQQVSTGSYSDDATAVQVELATLRERVRALERERDQLAEDKKAATEREGRLMGMIESTQRLLPTPKENKNQGIFSRFFVHRRKERVS